MARKMGRLPGTSVQLHYSRTSGGPHPTTLPLFHMPMLHMVPMNCNHAAASAGMHACSCLQRQQPSYPPPLT